jgi:hypothetical protein
MKQWEMVEIWINHWVTNTGQTWEAAVMSYQSYENHINRSDTELTAMISADKIRR